MTILRLLPVILSFLLLAAHFSRAGMMALSIITLLIPLLLLIKKMWLVRFLQVLLFAGAVEWVRTMFFYIEIRKSAGEDWTRLAVILSFVALFTMTSGLVFQKKSLKKIYNS
jgi:hypothetical protein